MELQGSYRQSAEGLIPTPPPPEGSSPQNPVITFNEVVLANDPAVNYAPKSDRHSKALKKCREHLVRGGDRLNIAAFKDVASHETFLDNLFQLFDEDGDGLVDQDEFLRPFYQIKDEKGRQFAEVLETATFAIAIEQNISPPVFARIFATKGLLDKLFRLMDKNGDNVVTITEAMDFIAKITVAQSQTSLTKENLEYLTKLFAENSSANNEITLENFRKIIRSKNVFFTERVFHIFDRDGSGTVSMQEFLDAVSKFSGQSMDNKIKFLFDIYDLDSDGRVQMIELRKVMQACMDENGMKFSEEQLDDLTTALFEDADPNNTGAITVEALKAQLEKHEGLLENLSYSIEKWLVPPRPVEQTSYQKLKESKPHQFSWQYMKNNHVFLIFLFLFIALNIALFASRIWEYRESNGWVQLARGCGQCLNFTCMFILVCMLRKFITWLRCLGVSAIVPLDEHIYFHKLTGWLILLYTVGHTVAHIVNLTVVAKEMDEDVGEFVIKWLFTTASGIGWIGKVAFPTGVALLIILVIMVICSQPFVRKNGNFEVFYWTHRLYIAFFILTFIHGPRFWYWFIVPGAIFAVELVLRFVQRRTGYGRTYIDEAVLLPSKVTHLVIKRPPNFHFHPGDYIFIKVPAIAKYEWHPFTISSAPEQDDVVWLHIRGVGEWTNQLFTHLNEQLEKLNEARNATAVDIHPDGGTKRRSIFSRGSRFIRSSAKKKLPLNGDVRAALGANAQGYENIGYTTRNGEGDQVSTSGFDQSMDGDTSKKRLSMAKSMPILDAKPMRPEVEKKILTRTASHQVASLRRGSGGGEFNDSMKLCIRQRSMGQSFRHMRRKPKTLPMPGLSSVIIQEEDESQDLAEATEFPVLSTTATVHGSEREQQPVEVAFSSTTQQSVIAIARQNAAESTIVCYDENSGEKPLDIIIDGPYGAPSSHIFRAEHAVLIGTGIGVTPFASILQSIMRRYWDARLSCPKCQYRWTSELPGSYLNLRKVDFFWINRDQKSFEWFVNLLSQLEIEQAEQGGAMERFLDMHMYITSALQKTDMKAVGLHLALDLLHEKEKRDLITGLKTRTQAGRPNWNKVFRQIAQQKKGKVTVFYCGPPQLATTLKMKCDEFGFSYKKEIF